MGIIFRNHRCKCGKISKVIFAKPAGSFSIFKTNMPLQIIKAFYNSTGVETDRLDQHVFQLEKIRSQQIIREYLKPGMTIADIGGATGSYSFWLHDMGQEVHLLDVAEYHIETAIKISKEKNKPLGSILLGDARSLPYPDNQFDLILLFGPLYHLQQKTDRIGAITEARRVLKPNGVLLAATISRYASLLDGFWQNYIDDAGFEKIIEQDLTNGNHFNTTGNPFYFTEAHFHSQLEIEEEFMVAGFTHFSIKAIEGFGWLVPGFINRWNDDTWREKLIHYIQKTESDPVMIGMSAHVMTVARKK